MRRLAGISAFIVLNGIAVQAQDLPFPSAVSQMYTSNQELKAAHSEVESKQYEKKAAAGLYFPSVSVSSMYTHLSDPLTLDLNPVRDVIAQLSAPGVTLAKGLPATATSTVQQQILSQLGDWDKMIQKQDFWVNSVSVRQPLWTGGKIIAANKAAAARVDEASQKYRYTQNKLMTELVERYFGYRLLLNVVDVRKEVLAGMEKHLSEAVAMEKSGIISQSERLHAEVVRANAQREYQKAVRDADIAQTGLKDTLATSSETRPSTPLFVLDKIDEMDYFKQQARERNPLLQQIVANKILAKQGYMKELARFSPDIFAFGSYDFYSWQKSEYAPQWFVGVGATMTLFEGLGGYNSKKAAGALIDRVAMIEQKAYADIFALVEKNYNEMMKSREELTSLNSSLSFANEFLRVRQKAFQEGLATSTDLTDAQLNLSQVKIERLKALYDYDLALARLLEVSGLSDQFETFRNAGTAEVQQ